MKLLIYQLIVALAFYSTLSFAPDLPTEKIKVKPHFLNQETEAIVLVSKDQKPEDAKLLLAEDNTELQTTILFARPELLKNCKGVIILIPGMGGNVTRYGVSSSMIAYANSALKQGYYPIAVQNKVYFRASDKTFPMSERIKFARDLKDIKTHMEDLSQLFEHAAVEGKELWAFGRSNGAGQLLQWMDSLYRGELSNPEVAKKVTGIKVAGLNSPLYHLFNIWTHGEDVENSADPLDMDPIATWLDRTLYKQMKWARPKPRVENKSGLAKLPTVIAIVAAQDKYIRPETQIDTIASFSASHSDIPVRMLMTPGKHDPTASFEIPVLNGKPIKFRVGELIKEILQYKMHTRESGGIHTTTMPHFNAAPRCGDVLRLMGSLK